MVFAKRKTYHVKN